MSIPRRTRHHKFIVTVSNADSWQAARIAILAAFAKRDPDGCYFHLHKARPKRVGREEGE